MCIKLEVNSFLQFIYVNSTEYAGTSFESWIICWEIVSKVISSMCLSVLSTAPGLLELGLLSLSASATLFSIRS